jgi:hypothetical protein
MSNTHHHRNQRKRKQYTDPRPRRKERWSEDVLTTSFMGLAVPVIHTDYADYLYVDVGPGVRISHLDQVSYVADDHAPGCVHVFRRNAFIME